MSYLCDVSNGTDDLGYTILCTLDEYHHGPHVWSSERSKRTAWWRIWRPRADR